MGFSSEGFNLFMDPFDYTSSCAGVCVTKEHHAKTAVPSVGDQPCRQLGATPAGAFATNASDTDQFKQRIAADNIVLHVVEAVDGRLGRLSLMDAPLTPYTRYGLLHRIEISNPKTLNTTEAVAIFMSHRRCWQRVIDSQWDAALIFEDDACPHTSMQNWLEQEGRRLWENPEKMHALDASRLHGCWALCCDRIPLPPMAHCRSIHEQHQGGRCVSVEAPLRHRPCPIWIALVHGVAQRSEAPA